MEKTRSKPTWRLKSSKSISDHIKYEVPLKVKQSDRYEMILIKACLIASTSKSMQVLCMYILMKLFGYNDGSIDVYTRLRSSSETWNVRMRIRMDEREDMWNFESMRERRRNATRRGNECGITRQLCHVSLFFRPYNIVFYFVKCYFAFT